MIAGMTVSVDGFVADPAGSADRLYTDLADLQGSAYMNALIQETGVVLMGRRTFEMGDPDWYVGNYEFQVPIFVLTHQPPGIPPKQDDRLTFTFVSGSIVSAVEQAKAAATSGREPASDSASGRPASIRERVCSRGVSVDR